MNMGHSFNYNLCKSLVCTHYSLLLGTKLTEKTKYQSQALLSTVNSNLTALIWNLTVTLTVFFFPIGELISVSRTPNIGYYFLFAGKGFITKFVQHFRLLTIK